MVTTSLDELRTAGLLDGSDAPHLTDKGRDWLRVLEDLREQNDDFVSYAAADFVLSTNGLFR